MAADDPNTPSPTPQPSEVMPSSANPAAQRPVTPSPETVVLEQMMRRAMLTAYTMISHRIRDAHQTSVDLATLIDLLIAKGTVSYQEMTERRKVSEERISRASVEKWEGPQLHVSAPVPEVKLDCESRQSECQSACCRM